MRFKDKTVIVTGAGQGIGEALTLGFAREGARVVIATVTPAHAQTVARKVEQLNARALIQITDVTRKTDVEKMVEATVNTFGKIDILVNNAGILYEEPFVSSTEEQYHEMYEVNVKGLFLCAQAVCKQMMKQKKGKIINVSSIAAIVGQINLSLYSSSKGAVLSLTRAMALELAPHNVQVNAILPGTTETPMSEKALANPQIRAQHTSGIPLDRLGKPEDHVGAVFFFASEESNWCTGQTLIVDGGYTMV